MWADTQVYSDSLCLDASPQHATQFYGGGDDMTLEPAFQATQFYGESDEETAGAPPPVPEEQHLPQPEVRSELRQSPTAAASDNNGARSGRHCTPRRLELSQVSNSPERQCADDVSSDKVEPSRNLPGPLAEDTSACNATDTGSQRERRSADEVSHDIVEQPSRNSPDALTEKSSGGNEIETRSKGETGVPSIASAQGSSERSAAPSIRSIYFWPGNKTTAPNNPPQKQVTPPPATPPHHKQQSKAQSPGVVASLRRVSGAAMQKFSEAFGRAGSSGPLESSCESDLANETHLTSYPFHSESVTNPARRCDRPIDHSKTLPASLGVDPADSSAGERRQLSPSIGSGSSRRRRRRDTPQRRSTSRNKQTTKSENSPKPDWDAACEALWSGHSPSMARPRPVPSLKDLLAPKQEEIENVPPVFSAFEAAAVTITPVTKRTSGGNQECHLEFSQRPMKELTRQVPVHVENSSIGIIAPLRMSDRRSSLGARHTTLGARTKTPPRKATYGSCGSPRPDHDEACEVLFAGMTSARVAVPSLKDLLAVKAEDVEQETPAAVRTTLDEGIANAVSIRNSSPRANLTKAVSNNLVREGSADQTFLKDSNDGKFNTLTGGSLTPKSARGRLSFTPKFTRRNNAGQRTPLGKNASNARHDGQTINIKPDHDAAVQALWDGMSPASARPATMQTWQDLLLAVKDEEVEPSPRTSTFGVQFSPASALRRIALPVSDIPLESTTGTSSSSKEVLPMRHSDNKSDKRWPVEKCNAQMQQQLATGDAISKRQPCASIQNSSIASDKANVSQHDDSADPASTIYQANDVRTDAASEVLQAHDSDLSLSHPKAVASPPQGAAPTRQQASDAPTGIRHEGWSPFGDDNMNLRQTDRQDFPMHPPTPQWSSELGGVSHTDTSEIGKPMPHRWFGNAASDVAVGTGSTEQYKQGLVCMAGDTLSTSPQSGIELPGRCASTQPLTTTVDTGGMANYSAHGKFVFGTTGVTQGFTHSTNVSDMRPVSSDLNIVSGVGGTHVGDALGDFSVAPDLQLKAVSSGAANVDFHAPVGVGTNALHGSSDYRWSGALAKSSVHASDDFEVATTTAPASPSRDTTSESQMTQEFRQLHSSFEPSGQAMQEISRKSIPEFGHQVSQNIDRNSMFHLPVSKEASPRSSCILPALGPSHDTFGMSSSAGSSHHNDTVTQALCSRESNLEFHSRFDESWACHDSASAGTIKSQDMSEGDQDLTRMGRHTFENRFSSAKHIGAARGLAAVDVSSDMTLLSNGARARPHSDSLNAVLPRHGSQMESVNGFNASVAEETDAVGAGRMRAPDFSISQHGTTAEAEETLRDDHSNSVFRPFGASPKPLPPAPGIYNEIPHTSDFAKVRQEDDTAVQNLCRHESSLESSSRLNDSVDQKHSGPICSTTPQGWLGNTSRFDEYVSGDNHRSSSCLASAPSDIPLGFLPRSPVADVSNEMSCSSHAARLKSHGDSFLAPLHPHGEDSEIASGARTTSFAPRDGPRTSGGSGEALRDDAQNSRLLPRVASPGSFSRGPSPHVSTAIVRTSSFAEFRHEEDTLAHELCPRASAYESVGTTGESLDHGDSTPIGTGKLQGWPGDTMRDLLAVGKESFGVNQHTSMHVGSVPEYASPGAEGGIKAQGYNESHRDALHPEGSNRHRFMASIPEKDLSCTSNISLQGLDGRGLSGDNSIRGGLDGEINNRGFLNETPQIGSCEQRLHGDGEGSQEVRLHESSLESRSGLAEPMSQSRSTAMGSATSHAWFGDTRGNVKIEKEMSCGTQRNPIYHGTANCDAPPRSLSRSLAEDVSTTVSRSRARGGPNDDSPYDTLHPDESHLESCHGFSTGVSEDRRSASTRCRIVQGVTHGDDESAGQTLRYENQNAMRSPLTASPTSSTKAFTVGLSNEIPRTAGLDTSGQEEDSHTQELRPRGIPGESSSLLSESLGPRSHARGGPNDDSPNDTLHPDESQLESCHGFSTGVSEDWRSASTRCRIVQGVTHGDDESVGQTLQYENHNAMRSPLTASPTSSTKAFTAGLSNEIPRTAGLATSGRAEDSHTQELCPRGIPGESSSLLNESVGQSDSSQIGKTRLQDWSRDVTSDVTEEITSGGHCGSAHLVGAPRFAPPGQSPEQSPRITVEHVSNEIVAPMGGAQGPHDDPPFGALQPHGAQLESRHGFSAAHSEEKGSAPTSCTPIHGLTHGNIGRADETPRHANRMAMRSPHAVSPRSLPRAHAQGLSNENARTSEYAAVGQADDTLAQELRPRDSSKGSIGSSGESSGQGMSTPIGRTSLQGWAQDGIPGVAEEIFNGNRCGSANLVSVTRFAPHGPSPEQQSPRTSVENVFSEVARPMNEPRRGPYDDAPLGALHAYESQIQSCHGLSTDFSEEKRLASAHFSPGQGLPDNHNAMRYPPAASPRSLAREHAPGLSNEIPRTSELAASRYSDDTPTQGLRSRGSFKESDGFLDESLDQSHSKELGTAKLQGWPRDASRDVADAMSRGSFKESDGFSDESLGQSHSQEIGTAKLQDWPRDASRDVADGMSRGSFKESDGFLGESFGQSHSKEIGTAKLQGWPRDASRDVADGMSRGSFKESDGFLGESLGQSHSKEIGTAKLLGWPRDASRDVADGMSRGSFKESDGFLGESFGQSHSKEIGTAKSQGWPRDASRDVPDGISIGNHLGSAHLVDAPRFAPLGQSPEQLPRPSIEDVSSEMSRLTDRALLRERSHWESCHGFNSSIAEEESVCIRNITNQGLSESGRVRIGAAGGGEESLQDDDVDAASSHVVGSPRTLPRAPATDSSNEIPRRANVNIHGDSLDFKDTCHRGQVWDSRRPSGEPSRWNGSALIDNHHVQDRAGCNRDFDLKYLAGAPKALPLGTSITPSLGRVAYDPHSSTDGLGVTSRYDSPPQQFFPDGSWKPRLEFCDPLVEERNSSPIDDVTPQGLHTRDIERRRREEEALRGKYPPSARQLDDERVNADGASLGSTRIGEEFPFEDTPSDMQHSTNICRIESDVGARVEVQQPQLLDLSCAQHSSQNRSIESHIPSEYNGSMLGYEVPNHSAQGGAPLSDAARATTPTMDYVAERGTFASNDKRAQNARLSHHELPTRAYRRICVSEGASIENGNVDTLTLAEDSAPAIAVGGQCSPALAHRATSSKVGGALKSSREAEVRESTSHVEPPPCPTMIRARESCDLVSNARQHSERRSDSSARERPQMRSAGCCSGEDGSDNSDAEASPPVISPRASTSTPSRHAVRQKIRSPTSARGKERTAGLTWQHTGLFSPPRSQSLSPTQVESDSDGIEGRQEARPNRVQQDIHEAEEELSETAAPPDLGNMRASDETADQDSSRKLTEETSPLQEVARLEQEESEEDEYDEEHTNKPEAKQALRAKQGVDQAIFKQTGDEEEDVDTEEERESIEASLPMRQPEDAPDVVQADEVAHSQATQEAESAAQHAEMAITHRATFNQKGAGSVSQSIKTQPRSAKRARVGENINAEPSVDNVMGEQQAYATSSAVSSPEAKDSGTRARSVCREDRSFRGEDCNVMGAQHGHASHVLANVQEDNNREICVANASHDTPLAESLPDRSVTASSRTRTVSKAVKACHRKLKSEEERTSAHQNEGALKATTSCDVAPSNAIGIHAKTSSIEPPSRNAADATLPLEEDAVHMEEADEEDEPEENGEGPRTQQETKLASRANVGLDHAIAEPTEEEEEESAEEEYPSIESSLPMRPPEDGTMVRPGECTHAKMPRNTAAQRTERSIVHGTLSNEKGTLYSQSLEAQPRPVKRIRTSEDIKSEPAPEVVESCYQAGVESSTVSQADAIDGGVEVHCVSQGDQAVVLGTKQRRVSEVRGSPGMWWQKPLPSSHGGPVALDIVAVAAEATTNSSTIALQRVGKRPNMIKMEQMVPRASRLHAGGVSVPLPPPPLAHVSAAAVAASTPWFAASGPPSAAVRNVGQLNIGQLSQEVLSSQAQTCKEEMASNGTSKGKVVANRRASFSRRVSLSLKLKHQRSEAAAKTKVANQADQTPMTDSHTAELQCTPADAPQPGVKRKATPRGWKSAPATVGRIAKKKQKLMQPVAEDHSTKVASNEFTDDQDIQVAKSNLCFVATGLEFSCRQKRFLQNKLGASIVEEWTDEVTHLIAKSFKRTAKLMCAICKGAKIVLPEYVNACVAAGALVDDAPYAVRDTLREKEFALKRGLARGYSLNDAIQKAQYQGPLLKGVSVYCFPSVIEKLELPMLVAAAGGTWLTRLPKAPDDDSVLLLAERTVSTGREQLRRKQHEVYDVELLREAACTQELRRCAYRLR